LPRRTIDLENWSRGLDGLPAERFPSRVAQKSTTYGLLTVPVLRDFALWRDDLAFAKEQLRGARLTLESGLALLADDGLLGDLPGWSFVDWVPNWSNGIPPDGDAGSIVNLHLLLALRAGAELEKFFGDDLLARRWTREAENLARRIREKFWHPRRQLFADDRAKKSYSEHAQCLALFSDCLRGSEAKKCFAALLAAPDLYRTTVYFRFYLFETYQRFGRGELVLPALDFWREMTRIGLKTPVEHPEPARSDCHAWSSHPLYHLFATVAGIRPAAPGFREVLIAPQVGHLPDLKVEMPHPRGAIKLDLTFAKTGDRGTIILPKGLTGTYRRLGKTQTLIAGKNVMAPV
jgi:hypothetical protein